MQANQENKPPLNWPFPVYNGQKVSLRILRKRKVPKYAPVYPDAPY
jgi:hypothetical protein